MNPKLSITIPSYNQADYLEETLCSVLGQRYPNLELIVIDGGSTDGSVEILKRYSHDLAYWISEPDRGQTHAINKGLEHSTGEVISYLNSDDLLLPGSLHRIGELFENPETLWIGAVSETFDQSGCLGQVNPQLPTDKWEYLTPWHRSSEYVFPCSNVSFMRRNLVEKCGRFDESYNYGMDIEYYLRAVFQAGVEPQLIPDVLGRWRWHEESKTWRQGLAYGFREDEVRMAIQYASYLQPAERSQVLDKIREQQKQLVSRKVMFYRKRGERKRAWLELISQIKAYPDLLIFRPWYGALRRLMSV